MRKNCSSDPKNLFRFKAENLQIIFGWLEQFIQTVKGQNKFWKQMYCKNYDSNLKKMGFGNLQEKLENNIDGCSNNGMKWFLDSHFSFIPLLISCSKISLIIQKSRHPIVQILKNVFAIVQCLPRPCLIERPDFSLFPKLLP